MSAKTGAIQGSGWGWLGYNPETSKLEIVTTANQDPLLCMYLISCSSATRTNHLLVAHVPIIGIDIWEHVRLHNMRQITTLILRPLCLGVLPSI